MAKPSQEVYMLQLHGWGGADMLTLFDPRAAQLTSIAEKRRPIGSAILSYARGLWALGNHSVPHPSPLPA